MDLNSRFTEYGLTGAFFAVLQLFILFIFFDVTPNDISTFESSFKISFGPLGTLATIIGIICIFFVGQLLHTLTVILVPSEMPIFWKSLENNQSVLRELYSGNEKNYYANCLYRFYTEYGGGNALSFSPKKVWQRFKLFLPYLQAQDYLLARVISTVELNDYTLLKDRLNNWQATRAFSVALIITFLEILYLTLSGNKPEAPVITADPTHLLIATALLLVVAIWVSRTAFRAWSRLLFALVYAADQNKPD